ncbi:MAG: MFS transporter, partial [Actinomycetota bacterium]
AVGIWSAAAGMGVGFGPLIGSVLLELSGWQAVFFINVPVCLVGAGFAIAILPESRRPGVPPLDLLGAVTSIVALGGIVFALIEGGDGGFGQTRVLIALALGILAAGAFIVLELRRRFPLFDVRILRQAPVFSGAVALVACYLSFFGSLFLLPQLLYFVQDRSTLITGLALCPMGVALGVLGPTASHLLARIGPRATLFIGVCVMALGTAVQLLNTADSSIVVVLAGVFIYGAGLGVTITPATAMIMNEVGTAKAGDGAALNQVSRQIGGALGVALVGSAFAVVYRSGVGDHLSGLDSTARTAIARGIEATEQTAAGLAPAIKSALLGHANHSFEVAARAGLGVCILALLVSALVTLVALRPRPLRGSSGAVVDSPS